MPSHRMPESERPRRSVPAWVTAPPEDADSPASSAPTVASAADLAVGAVAAGTAVVVASSSSTPSGPEAHPTSAPPVLDPHAVVPDYPPVPELLPPAPTSPNVDTVPFSTVAGAHPAPSADPAAARGVPATQVPATRSARRAAGRHDGGQPAAPRADTVSAAGMALPVAPVLGGPQAAGPGAPDGTVDRPDGSASSGTMPARRGPGDGAAPGRPDGQGHPAVTGHPAGAGRPADVGRADGPTPAVVPGAVGRTFPGAPGGTAAPAGAPEVSWTPPTLPGPPAGGSAVAAPAAPPAPIVPSAGQPRFSVPGLEHVVVEGTEPEPVGPIGYRTPARFARQQARVVPPAVTAPPSPAGAPPSFDALLAAPAPTTALPFVDPTAATATATDGAQHSGARPAGSTSPVVPAPAGPGATGQDDATRRPSVAGAEPDASTHAAHAPTPAREHRNASPERGRTPRRPGLLRRRSAEAPKLRATAVPVPAQADTAPSVERATDATTDLPSATETPAPSRPARTGAGPAARRSLGPTPGALLGAVAGLGTIGLAAWWFTAPATVHAVGVVLGLLAVLVSVVTMRDPATTWQRPVALLGAVLGTVGTLVLLWAVAVALGAPLPDITGTGTVPTIAP